VGDGAPLNRLARILGIEGEPIADYGWTEVIEAVENLDALGEAFHKLADEAATRTCMVYDHAVGGPCRSKPLVQGVCEDHAVICSMCGKELSAREICPGCVKVLAAEARAAAPTTAPDSAPPVAVPATRPVVTEVAPPKRHRDDADVF
jgi:hypothetical protein